MGLDASSTLLYGIIVRREEVLMPGPEVKACLRHHRYPLESPFRFCPECSSEIVVISPAVPRPELLALWPDLTEDLGEWKGEGHSTWGKPNAVSFHSARQTRDSGESRRDPAQRWVLGVRLVETGFRRNDSETVCSVNEYELDVWRPRIRTIANKAKWGGRELELVVSTYLSY